LAYIYKVVNDINDKVYIGKTEFDIQKRWKEHCADCYRDRCEKRPLYNAMRKYGIDHFSILLIEETNDPSAREEYWIAYYDSYRNGYNATVGGDGKKYLNYEKIVATYCSGHNLKETATICGVCEDSVRNILRQFDIEIVSSGIIVKEKYTKAVAMYDVTTKQLVQVFQSAYEAARHLIENKITNYQNVKGVGSHITRACNSETKNAYGYGWKYA
jgi:hypothetical protein